jgi:probable HAF family extracellular repeat protein
MKVRNSLFMRSAVAALIAMMTVAVSCRDANDEPTAPPAVANAAKNGGPSAGPTVSSVVPDRSPPGVTLNITVNGSGFAQGSVVTLERQGFPAAKITTNATTFVSPKKLTANVTIAADADTGKYDVAVFSSGRKGVGIESFTVAYVLDELGIIGGTWSRAHAINERGEVVGASCTSDCLGTAFYWTEAGGLEDLGTLAGYSRSEAYAINSRGQVFGAAICRAADPGCGGVGRTSLVRWDRVGAGWTRTPVAGCSIARPLGEYTERFVINNNDQCVARTQSALLVQTLSGGTVVNTVSLPSLHVDGYNAANAISDASMVAGFAATVLERTATGAALGPPQPVVWYRRATGAWALLQLGFPSTDLRAFATDISEPDAAGRVRVTGYTESDGRQSSIRAVRWTLRADGSGGWQVASTEVLQSTLGTGPTPHGWPLAVNSSGDMVGIAGQYVMEGSPVMWPMSGGTGLLPVSGGGAQGRATDINNQGWIVGAVWDNVNNCDRAAIWRPQ